MKYYSISNFVGSRQEIPSLLSESNYNLYWKNQYILLKAQNIKVHDHHLRDSQIDTCRENES